MVIDPQNKHENIISHHFLHILQKFFRILVLIQIKILLNEKITLMTHFENQKICQKDNTYSRYIYSYNLFLIVFFSPLNQSRKYINMIFCLLFYVARSGDSYIFQIRIQRFKWRIRVRIIIWVEVPEGCCSICLRPGLGIIRDC